MSYRLEKLTIRDTFKQWRDKINTMTDKMNGALTADENGVMTIGPEECNTIKFVVKVPTYFESIVHFIETENEGSYISTITSATIADTVNAGLVLTGGNGEDEFVPWISGKTATGHITQYTSNNNDNLYFSFVGDDGTTKELFHWDNELNRIEGTISHAVTADNADKIKSVATNANKNYKISFGEKSSDSDYASLYEDGELTYNPYENRLTASIFDGYLDGTAKRAEDADNADKLKNAVTISLTNHVTGSTQFDGSTNVNIPVTIPTTGVTSGTYGQTTAISATYGGSFTVPSYTVNDRGQLTQSKNVTVTLPDSVSDELVVQNHSANAGPFPILAVTLANANASLGPKETLFNKDIKIDPSNGKIIATNAEITNTLSVSTINATIININGKIVPTDELVVHKSGEEIITGEKTFKATSGNTYTYWDNPAGSHKIGIRVNTNNYAGLYDFTNDKWIIQVQPDGTTVVKAKADTADKLANARKLGVNLATTFTNADDNNASFDGSQNQLGIPIKGTLKVENGGTGVTSIANIKAGKDADGNVITATYATKTEMNTKAPLVSPTFTGNPTAPSITDLSDSSDKIATTKFVNSAITTKINNALGAVEAMEYKGTLGTNGTITELPENHTKGWTYKVITADTYAGKKCEVGDMIICNKNGTTNNNAHWDVIQGNIDGAVIGPETSTTNHIAVFSNDKGKLIKDSGFTIGCSIPANATFTDTTYANGSKAMLVTGTNTDYRVWTPKDIHDYVQTPATTSAKGVVQIGSNISVDTAGKISVQPASTSVFGAVKIAVNNGLTVANGLLNINPATTSVFGSVKVGSNITVSSGVISITKANVTTALGYTPPTKDTTYSVFVKSGSTAASGLVPKPDTTAGTTKFLCENGTWKVPPDTNTTYSNMTGASSDVAGKAGLVPAPAKGKQSSFLRGDGTWAVPPDTNTTYSVFKASGSTAAAGLVPKPSTTAGTTKFLCENGTWKVPPDTNTTYSNATTSAAGLMSAADKKKLNSITLSSDYGAAAKIVKLQYKQLSNGSELSKRSNGTYYFKSPSDGKYFIYGYFTSWYGTDPAYSKQVLVNEICSANTVVGASTGTNVIRASESDGVYPSFIGWAIRCV